MPAKKLCTNEETILPEVDIDQVREELFEDRKVFLNEPITNSILYSVWHPIEQLIKLDDKTPITLYINSEGGDAYVSLFLASYILQSKVPIHTVITGNAQSGASIISMSGHRRLAYKYSTIMLHLPQTGMDRSTSNNLMSQAKGVEMLDEDIYDLMLRKTKMSKQLIKKKLQQDWYLGGGEALKYGIVDEIL